MPQHLHEQPLDDLLENLCRIVATVGRGSAAEKAARDAVGRKFGELRAYILVEVDAALDELGRMTGDPKSSRAAKRRLHGGVRPT